MSFMNTTVQVLFTPHFVLYMIFFDSPICMLAGNKTQTLFTLQKCDLCIRTAFDKRTYDKVVILLSLMGQSLMEIFFLYQTIYLHIFCDSIIIIYRYYN